MVSSLGEQRFCIGRKNRQIHRRDTGRDDRGGDVESILLVEIIGTRHEIEIRVVAGQVDLLRHLMVVLGLISGQQIQIGRVGIDVALRRGETRCRQ